ncbi:MAG TPA: HPP family protein [Xanthobacteraceae bacterium]|nr:HPP family protein [Xanthobacteraceae bacterium]
MADDEPLRENLRENWKTYAWRALGGAVGIYAMMFLAEMGHLPIALVPFATSVVNVIALPDALPGQPRALIGGHLISAFVGLSVLTVFGSSAFTAALAVGIAILAMHLTRTMHPPAGINPLIIVTASLPWSFLLVPVLAGVVILTGLAYIWHGIENHFVDQQGKWPARWF